MRPIDLQMVVLRGPEAVNTANQMQEALAANQQAIGQNMVVRAQQEMSQIKSNPNVENPNLRNSTEGRRRNPQMIVRKRKEKSDSYLEDEYRGKFIDVRL